MKKYRWSASRRKRQLLQLWKKDPLNGSPRGKGIVLKKKGVEQKQPHSGIIKCVRVQLSKNNIQVTAFVPGTGATNLGKAIQSAQGTTDTGVPALVVRNDTLADLSGADGDYSPLHVNASGALYVEVTTSGLPSSADSEAKQDTIETTLTAIETDADTIAGAVSGTEMQVDVVASLPAGSNAIGKLAANSGVDIGDVDVTSLPALPAGTNSIGTVILGAGTAAVGKLSANSGVDI